MKKLALVAVLIAVCSVAASAGNVCTTIQSGLLLYQPGHYLAGQPITTGVNPYGYNYQAHAYNGGYFNAYAGGDGLPPYNGDDAAYLAVTPAAASHWAWPYRNVDVAMKWNDAWISNRDCDGDGKLDRHFGFATYTGSGAWLTNHNSSPVTVGGNEQHASEFIKIVANPVNSYIAAPVSYFGEDTVYLNGKVLGDQIWGEFAVIQYVLNDPSTGDHGLRLKSQIAAGFGKFQP
ncbi:MAG: hypothetical protein HZB13_09765 [Acidobacteria bacterium]|nr:hypothetical protein [Acidobacteriota bacterium]